MLKIFQAIDNDTDNLDKYIIERLEKQIEIQIHYVQQDVTRNKLSIEFKQPTVFNSLLR